MAKVMLMMKRFTRPRCVVSYALFLLGTWIFIVFSQLSTIGTLSHRRISKRVGSVEDMNKIEQVGMVKDLWRGVGEVERVRIAFVNNSDNLDRLGREKSLWIDNSMTKGIGLERLEGRMQGMGREKAIGVRAGKQLGNNLTATHLHDVPMLPPFITESSPNGKGEYGEPVIIYPNRLSIDDKQKFDEGYKLNSFNQFASDVISVNRRLPDPRSSECRSISHQSHLQASIIMCFHDEAWSVLLRSVNSIINRSPLHLLKEVILVDDASDLEHLGAPLERYLDQLKGIVRVVRTVSRQGLTRARLLGYQHATAPVLVFLDSHIECFPGWLEPLLDRIAEKPHAVPFPTIDSINSDTLSVRPHYPHGVGTFSWVQLTFRWMSMDNLLTGKPRSPTAPIRSATMPGGLFAISREWFTRLGTYDDGLEYWGGENMELSLKVWMCNGSVEILPCSHVGHIFRHNNPIKWPVPGSVRRNSARVAEVWMDDYKQYLYETLGNEKVNFGNISHRHDLRRKLKCHGFDWYLTHVHPELHVPTDCQTVGEIQNSASKYCIDSKGRRSLYPEMYSCSGHGGHQFWCLRDNGEIWNYYQKLNIKHGRVTLDVEKGTTWTWTKEGFLQDNNGGHCLDANKKSVFTKPCSGAESQVWHLKYRQSTPSNKKTS